jgi:hypothetical protein
MKNTLLNIFFFLCLFSCKKEHSKTSLIKSTESLKNFEKIIEKEKEKKINLDYFEITPDTIDGCGYTFGYDSINKSLSKDIFVSNITDFAIIKVNGKNVYLKKDTIESKQISIKNFRDVFIGNDFKTIINFELYNQREESYELKGTLEISRKNKFKKIIKIRGQGGC